jgi:hypothetical protein
MENDPYSAVSDLSFQLDRIEEELQLVTPLSGEEEFEQEELMSQIFKLNQQTGKLFNVRNVRDYLQTVQNEIDQLRAKTEDLLALRVTKKSTTRLFADELCRPPNAAHDKNFPLITRKTAIAYTFILGTRAETIYIPAGTEIAFKKTSEGILQMHLPSCSIRMSANIFPKEGMLFLDENDEQ